MPVMPIRTLGDPVLRTPADPVTDFGPSLRHLVADMIETMYAAPGVGLAAPQVGVSLRLFVFDVDWTSDGSPRAPRAVANPELEVTADTETEQEGCLSVPGLYFPTPRAAKARLRGVDENGAPVHIVGTGLLARCLQHEVDHLGGVIYLDRLADETRDEARQALRDQTMPR